ncbi:arylphorin subunit alpha-like [Athalia rosae]|uniref:arylphorin subunit alpha-like n=1 Tax=Athalia rosae TaxID=37344 RepID=UPI002033AC0F|nr:arylphorin subunit alpha-like [Athalia rosae]
MFRYSAIVALVAFYFSAVALGEPVYADDELLRQQKEVYDVLHHVDQADIAHPKFFKIAKEFDIETYLTTSEHGKDFYNLWKYGKVLPRGAVFSVFYPVHVEEVKALFKVFFYVKNYDDLIKVAAWSRVHLNEFLFPYAFSVAVYHHPLFRNIRLPPHSELYPSLYFHNEVLQKAKNVKIQHDTTETQVTVDGAIIIPANYSHGYQHYHTDDEWKVSYYTEDVSLANLFYYLHLAHPFWLRFDEFELPLRNPGETYLWSHQLRSSRFYLERLSNGLGEVKRINWYHPVPVGYHPSLTFHNGLPLPHREAGSDFGVFYLIDRVRQYHQRIFDATDLGYYRNHTGELEYFWNKKGIDTLGRIIAGYPSPAHPTYYGPYESFSRSALGFSPKPVNELKVVPSALEFDGVAQRDPIYWSWSASMLGFYENFIQHLPQYSWNQLVNNEVEIVSIDVDPITTFFDYVDIPITNGVKIRDVNDRTVIKARQLRLNHKPFNYRFQLKTDHDVTVNIRTFIGAVEDSFGNPLDITENWPNMFLLDFFTKKLKVGINQFERSSLRAANTANVGLYDEDFYQSVVDAIAGKRKLEIPEQFHGYPNHLVIPKGTTGGMKFQFLFFIDKYDETHVIHHKSRLIGDKIYADQPQGYPLERPPIANFTLLPNVHVEHVVITHKEFRDINRTI